MKAKSIFRNSAGDTIVEVLLALVVLGVILAGAYNLANRALIINQEAAERTESVNLLRQQLEMAAAIGGSNACAAPRDSFHMTRTADVIGKAPSDIQIGLYSIELSCANILATPGLSEITAKASWDAIGGSGVAGGKQSSTLVLRVGDN